MRRSVEAYHVQQNIGAVRCGSRTKCEPRGGPMNSVLSEILNTGTTKTADGTGTVKVHSANSLSQGQLLQKLIRQVDPTITLEVGLAYGVSALFICDALHVRNGTQHIAIDPNQHGGPWGDSWEGIGITNLHRAGY